MEKIQNYLATQYPNAVVRFIGAGWDSYAFMIDNYIARFSKLKSSNYEFEKKVLDYIRDKVPAPIPKIDIIHDGAFSYSLHRRLDGKQWNKNKVLENRPHEKQQNLIQDFADFLVALHSIDVQQMKAVIGELENFSYTPYSPFVAFVDNEHGDFDMRYPDYKSSPDAAR